jgi:hypothetical protein
VDANGDGFGNAERKIRTLMTRSLLADFHDPRLFAKQVADSLNVNRPGFGQIRRRIVPFIDDQVLVRLSFVCEGLTAAHAYGRSFGGFRTRRPFLKGFGGQQFFRESGLHDGIILSQARPVGPDGFIEATPTE